MSNGLDKLKMGSILHFEVKFNLESQGQSPPKTIGILTKVFYTYSPNLVILAWTGDELSRGQTWWRTDWRTDGQTQATTIPEGQYWPRVKNRQVKWKEFELLSGCWLNSQRDWWVERWLTDGLRGWIQYTHVGWMWSDMPWCSYNFTVMVISRYQWLRK